jgi:predicted P-loop ATPase
MHWRIFPCHSVVAGQCTCGKISCLSKGKHPRTRGGFKDATDDEATIRRWWSRWPDANIALATGSGLAVFDIDGAEGAQEFKALVAAHGAVPETLAAQTGRGIHLVFATRPGAGEVRSSARGHVHVRGEGGYIIVAPSNHISGKEYKWILNKPLAELPNWLRQWSQGYEITKTAANPFMGLGQLPAHLQTKNVKDISSNASEALKTVWTPAEQGRLISALAAIPVKACGYDEFLKIGFALHSLDWQRSDGTSVAFELWNSWCAQSEHHNQAGLDAKWKGFDRSARGEVSVATIYHMARQMGWNGGIPSLAHSGSEGIDSPARDSRSSGNGTHLNGTANGVNTLPAAFGGQQAILFPDLNDKNQPRATMLNTITAIGALGITCRQDTFHNRRLVAGEMIGKWNAPELTDDIIIALRYFVRLRFGFDPNKQNTYDACETMCDLHRFNPVTDYLDSLRWDGKARLEYWLSSYMGALDNEFIRAVGRLTLIAAVRRARNPGAKFDQVIVLEGPEGKGKSRAIEILAGPENFSDQSILNADEKTQQELLEGVWLYEIAELAGMRKADVDHVKSFISRTEDRARAAYAHYKQGRKRSTILFATTNDAEYLKSDTGNRRFWPVKVENIDLAALARDRDQLWAEAALREARGDSIGLPENLWKAAGHEQESRLEVDSVWRELIAQYIELKKVNDVSTREVLADNQFLRIEPGRIGHSEQVRAAKILRSLGFKSYKRRIGSDTQNRFRKE